MRVYILDKKILLEICNLFDVLNDYINKRFGELGIINVIFDIEFKYTNIYNDVIMFSIIFYHNGEILKYNNNISLLEISRFNISSVKYLQILIDEILDGIVGDDDE